MKRILVTIKIQVFHVLKSLQSHPFDTNSQTEKLHEDILKFTGGTKAIFVGMW